MEKVLALQAQLKNLYQEKSTYKLSERSVVTIILKLQEKGDLALIYSLDGKEYITPEQLESEIRRELAHHGGRVGVADLQPWLNVDLKAIEEKTQWIVSRHHHIHLIHGELIGNDYLEGIAHEIAALLLEEGTISLSEVVNRYGLPTKFVLDNLLLKYPLIIRGEIEDSALYTSEYVERFRRRIRGALSAISRPTMISVFRSQFSENLKLFDGALEKLFAEGQLAGSLQGRGEHAVFVPFSFERSRLKWVEDFISQNSYVDYAMLSKLEVSNPKAFLQERFGSSGVLLSASFVSASIIEELDSISSDAVAESSLVNVLHHVRIPIGDGLRELLAELPSVKSDDPKSPKLYVLAQSWIVSSSLVTKIGQVAKELVEKHVRDTFDAQSTLISSTDQLTSSSSSSSSSNPKSKKEAQKKPAPFNFERFVDQALTKVSSGLKGIDEVDGKLVADITKKVEALLTSTKKEIEAELRKAEEDNTQVAAPEKPLAKSGAVAEDRRSNAPLTDKEKLKEFPKRADIMLLNLQFFSQGLEQVKNADTKTALSRYLLSTLAQDAMELLVEYHALLNKVSPGENLKTPEGRAGVVSKLPKDTQPVLSNVEKGSKKLETFLEAYTSALEAAGLQPKALSAKVARTLLFTHQKEAFEELKAQKNPLSAVPTLLAYLVMKAKTVGLYVDPRSLRPVLAELTGEISADLFRLLSDCLDRFEQFQASKLKTSNGDQALLQQLQTDLQKAQTFILDPKLDLKAFTLPAQ